MLDEFERKRDPDDHDADPGEPMAAPFFQDVADEVTEGSWHRRLVLPNQDGQLRLTPVKTVRTGPGTDTQNIRYLDDERGRQSA